MVNDDLCKRSNELSLAAAVWDNWLIKHWQEEFPEQKAELAEMAFKKAIEADETGWLRFCWLLAKRKRFTEAEQAYKKALENKPNSVNYWHFLENFSTTLNFLMKKNVLTEKLLKSNQILDNAGKPLSRF